MSTKVIIHNPAFLEDSDLISSFVARQVDFDWVMAQIRGAGEDRKPHLLLWGPRGAGKTMLVHRVAAELRRDPDLSEIWFPLALPEEINHVGTPGEFWLEAVAQLARDADQNELTQVVEHLMDDQEEASLSTKALAELLNFAESKGKRILLVVENFNRLVKKQIKVEGAQALLETLAGQPRITLLATATATPEEMKSPDGSLRGFFEVRKLEPLTDEECAGLWTSVTGSEPEQGRVKALRILTGGNPRLLAIISRFGADKSLKGLMDELMQLVDEHTGYFKNILDNLSLTEGKVYHALAEIWEPATARDVARIARYDTSTTSSYLAQLIDRGLVEVVRERARKKWYQLTERMYNIYYLMRRRGGAWERVRALVRFLQLMHSPEELGRMIISDSFKQDQRELDLHRLAYDFVLESTVDLSQLSRILSLTPVGFSSARVVPQSLRAQLKSDDPETARAAADSLAEIKPLVKSENIEEILRMYQRAVQVAPDNSTLWNMLGIVLRERRQFAEAEEAHIRALELIPHDPATRKLLGELYHEYMGRYDEALGMYREVLDREPEDAWTWAQIGILFHRGPKRLDDAEKAFCKSLSIERNDDRVWFEFGSLLMDAGMYDEAEKAFRNAVALDPDFLHAWGSLGILYYEEAYLNNPYEAEMVYRRIIELWPDFHFAWARLAEILNHKLGRFEEAELAYRKAIELADDFPGLWWELGRLLNHPLERYEEAAEAHRKAVELDVYATSAVRDLFSLLHLQLDRPTEALDLAERCIAENPEDSSLMVMFAGDLMTWRPSQFTAQAEKWVRKALELEPENAGYKCTLAEALALGGRKLEALELAKEYIVQAERGKEPLRGAISLFEYLAATGNGREAIGILMDSHVASDLEPLVVGIQMFLGKEVNAPVEVVEAAKDIVNSIEIIAGEIEWRSRQWEGFTEELKNYSLD